MVIRAFRSGNTVLYLKMFNWGVPQVTHLNHDPLGPPPKISNFTLWALLGALSASLVLLGASLAPLGRLLDAFGRLLSALGRFLGASVRPKSQKG